MSAGYSRVLRTMHSEDSDTRRPASSCSIWLGLVAGETGHVAIAGSLGLKSIWEFVLWGILQDIWLTELSIMRNRAERMQWPNAIQESG
jgi:hypothetical protein